MDSSIDVSGGPPPGSEHPEGVTKQAQLAHASNVYDSVVVQGNKNRVIYNELLIQMSPGSGPVLLDAHAVLAPPSRRAGPIDVRQSWPLPEPCQSFLDRHRERAACRADQPGVIELLGEYGIGKSSLLFHLGYELEERYPNRFQDGFTYIAARNLSFDELLYDVWTTFWESGAPWRPPIATMRLQLREVDSLILLDDPSLSESEFRSLTAALSRCSVLITVEESVVAAFGNSVLVGGLDRDDLMTVVRRQCEILNASETSLTLEVINAILAESHGNPKRCIRATSIALAPGQSPPEGYSSAQERAVKDTVQSFINPLPDDALISITTLKNAGIIADDLAKRGELDAHSPRYSYPWPKEIIPSYKINTYHLRLLEYLNGQDLEKRADLTDLTLELMEWIAQDPAGPTLVHSGGDVLPIAGSLAVRLATDGHIDRWARLSSAVGDIGRTARNAQLVAWSDRNLGVIAMCEARWFSARAHFEAAISHYSQEHEYEAAAECDDFLQAAIEAVGGGPDDRGGSSSVQDSGPRLPTIGSREADDRELVTT